MLRRSPLTRLAGLWPLAAVAFVIAVLPPRPSAPRAITGEKGMRLAIDPETGDPIGMPIARPGSSEWSLEQALDRSSVGLVVERHPDGSRSIDLQGRFHSASVARIGDRGVETHCTVDLDEARGFLHGEHAAPTHAEAEVR